MGRQGVSPTRCCLVGHAQPDLLDLPCELNSAQCQLDAQSLLIDGLEQPRTSGAVHVERGPNCLPCKSVQVLIRLIERSPGALGDLAVHPFSSASLSPELRAQTAPHSASVSRVPVPPRFVICGATKPARAWSACRGSAGVCGARRTTLARRRKIPNEHRAPAADVSGDRLLFSGPGHA